MDKKNCCPLQNIVYFIILSAEFKLPHKMCAIQVCGRYKARDPPKLCPNHLNYTMRWQTWQHIAKFLWFPCDAGYISACYMYCIMFINVYVYIYIYICIMYIYSARPELISSEYVRFPKKRWAWPNGSVEDRVLNGLRN